MKNTFNRFLCFVVIFGVFAFCGTFISCENLFGAKEKAIQEKAYITITTNLSTNARTVLPSEPFSDSSIGLTWTLTGISSGGAVQELGEWIDTPGATDADTTTAYNNMMSDTSITLNAGTWTFTLTAANESGKVLEATITQIITGGQNTLVFDMKEATGDDVAGGKIDFTLTFPGSVIKKVEATLTSREDENFLAKTDFTAETGVTETFLSEVQFTYSGNDNEALSAGNYILKLELQQQIGTTEATENPSAEPNYEIINTYTCLIHVAPGLCSKGEAELKTLAPLYEVIFEGTEGIEFEESIVSLSYNEYTTFALPTIKEEGGYEYQWHKTGDDPTTGALIDEPIEDPLKVCINENAHTFVLYCYKIVAEKDIFRTAKGVSTGDSFSIDTAEGLGIFRDLVNGCDENLKMVDNSEGSEKVFVYYETGSSKILLNATLTSDIDLTQDADGNKLSWVPINGYSGTFDGDGHTITVNNTYRVNGNRYYQGFFDTLDGATIKNLVVAGEETISESGLEYCGGIASQIENARGVDTTFENCVNKRNITVTTGVKGIGGFAGYTSSSTGVETNFVNCINLGTIKSEYSGIDYSLFSAAGFTKGATSYKMCINAGNVLGSSVTPDGTLHYSTVAGFDASVPANFEDCINLGDISANSYTAEDGENYSTEKVYGFSSINQYNSPTFTNCIDAGSAKCPFTGFVDNTIGTYVTSYYNSDSYGSSYNTDGLSCMSSNDLCIEEKTNFSNWSYDSSHYPLPKIEENFSKEIWQEVVAKATLPKGTRGNPFTTWEELAKYVYTSSDSETTVYIAGTLEATDMTYVYRPVTIMATGNATIKRVGNCTNFFQVGSNKSLKITGTEENNIILDGGDTSTTPLEVDSPLIYVAQDGGSVTLEYCTIQNANCGTSSYGAGLYATNYLSVTIKNCTFTNNTGYDIAIEQCNNLTLSGNVEIPKLYFMNELTTSELTINVDEKLTGSVNIVLDKYEGTGYDLELFNLDDGTSLPEGVFTLDDTNYVINSKGEINPIYSDWTTLADAIDSSANTTSEFVLKGNITATSKITVSNEITLKASDGVKITRGSNLTEEFFNNQSTLTLEGITLDGGKDLEIEATAPLITSSGSLTLNNCTLQNNKNTSDTPGGAINISEGTFTMNGGVIGSEVTENDLSKTYSWQYAADDSSYSNYAEAGGGGVYVASGDVTINGGKISYNYTRNPGDDCKGNTPENTAHGGGISIENGSLSLINSEVSYNSGYQGGGIRCYNDNTSNAGTLKLNGTLIKGNTSNPYRGSSFGGGLMVKNFNVTFEETTESTIEQNYSGDGGALFLEYTNSTLKNITIQNNSYNSNGYHYGSEVLLWANANVSIGSSDVTIISADDETRGIFMNNNNTLNLSGDAKLDTPIYLTNGAKVTVSEELTESTVATITPEQYNEETQVVEASEGVDIVGKFAVTPESNEDGTKTTYTIDSAGYLAKASSTDTETGGGTDGYEVGQEYYDDTGTLGYIFEIGTDYIKIASRETMTDDGSEGLQWCSSGLDESLFSITDGIEMKETIANLNTFGTYSLFYELRDSEWYVPTKDEFQSMVSNLSSVINFESSTFWTCTLDENQGNYAFYYIYGELISQSVTEYSDCIPVRKITF